MLRLYDPRSHSFLSHHLSFHSLLLRLFHTSEYLYLDINSQRSIRACCSYSASETMHNKITENVINIQQYRGANKAQKKVSRSDVLPLRIHDLSFYTYIFDKDETFAVMYHIGIVCVSILPWLALPTTVMLLTMHVVENKCVFDVSTVITDGGGSFFFLGLQC